VIDDEAQSGRYSVGLDDDLIMLVIDGERSVVRVRLPADEARRLVTLVLAACDIVEAADVDEMVGGWRS
jgi:hypothetical protein